MEHQTIIKPIRDYELNSGNLLEMIITYTGERLLTAIKSLKLFSSYKCVKSLKLNYLVKSTANTY